MLAIEIKHGVKEGKNQQVRVCSLHEQPGREKCSPSFPQTAPENPNPDTCTEFSRFKEGVDKNRNRRRNREIYIYIERGGGGRG